MHGDLMKEGILMKTRNTGRERGRTAAEIDVWENEGGAPGKDTMNHHMGVG